MKICKVYCFLIFFYAFQANAQKDSTKVSISVDAGFSYRFGLRVMHQSGPVISNSIHARLPIYSLSAQTDVPGFNYSVLVKLNKINAGLRIGHTMRIGQLYEQNPIVIDTNNKAVAYDLDKRRLMHDVHFGLFKRFRLGERTGLNTELQYSRMNKGTAYKQYMQYDANATYLVQNGGIHNMVFNAYSFFAGIYHNTWYAMAGVHCIPNFKIDYSESEQDLIDFEVKLGYSFKIK